MIAIAMALLISGCRAEDHEKKPTSVSTLHGSDIKSLLDYVSDADTVYGEELDTLPSTLLHVFLARQAHILSDSLFHIWIAKQKPELLEDPSERKMHLLLCTEHYEYFHEQHRFDSCIHQLHSPRFAPVTSGEDDLSRYVDQAFRLRQIEDYIDNEEKDRAARALADLELDPSQYGRLHRWKDWYHIRLAVDDSDRCILLCEGFSRKSGDLPFWSKRTTTLLLDTYYYLESAYTSEQLVIIDSLQQLALAQATIPRDTALIHYNQAWHHRQLDEHEQSIEQFVRARKIFVDLEQALYVAGVDRGLALATQSLGQYQRSNDHVVNFMQQLLDHDVQRAEDVRAIDLLTAVKLDTWGILADNCTELYRESGRSEDRAFAQKCFALIDSSLVLRDRYLEPDARNYLMGIYRAMYGLAMDAVLVDDPGPKQNQLAFRYIEQAKSNRIISRSAMRRCDEYGVPEDICDRESELLSRLQSHSTTASHRYTLEASLDSLRSIVQVDHPDYYRHRYITDELDLQDVKEFVQQHDLSVVQYHWYRDPKTYKETYCKLIITPDTVVLLTDTKADLRAALLAWHAAMADNDDIAMDSLDGELSRVLWDAAVPYLSTDHVVIIPDYHLYRFPFELLGYDWSARRPDSALLSRHIISYAYSSKSMLEQHRDLAPLGDRYLGMAYNDKSRSGPSDPMWEELPGTYDEVRRCTELTSSATAYYGKDCTRDRFLASAENHDILHLAVHGNYEDDRGYLQFRGDSTQRLYLEEIERMDLRGSLVMLTVCKAGDGSIGHSEGLYGVTNAFKVAGAQRVISSQWDVSDEVAKELVPLLVSHLAERPVPDALRQAKLDYLKNAKNKALTHPQYWAGFQAFGAR